MALRVRVCRLADVADDALRAFAVPHLTWPVIVTRVDGALVAFPGVCPHEDVALAEMGELSGCEVLCHGHGWAFDLQTGRCRHAPWLELRRYPVRVIDDEVWVDLL